MSAEEEADATRLEANRQIVHPPPWVEQVLRSTPPAVWPGRLVLTPPPEHAATRALGRLTRVTFTPRRCEVTIVDDLDYPGPDEYRLDAASDEAQAEIAAWDEILAGARRSRP